MCYPGYQHRVKKKGLHGVKISQESPSISHLMYADDLVIFYGADEQEAKAVADFVNTFTNWAGLSVNYKNLAIHFSKNELLEKRTSILNLLHMTEYDHHGKYFGLPFCKGASKKQAFNHIVDKMANKLQGWKVNSLS